MQHTQPAGSDQIIPHGQTAHTGLVAHQDQARPVSDTRSLQNPSMRGTAAGSCSAGGRRHYLTFGWLEAERAKRQDLASFFHGTD